MCEAWSKFQLTFAIIIWILRFLSDWTSFRKLKIISFLDFNVFMADLNCLIGHAVCLLIVAFEYVMSLPTVKWLEDCFFSAHISFNLDSGSSREVSETGYYNLEFPNIAMLAEVLFFNNCNPFSRANVSAMLFVISPIHKGSWCVNQPK